MTVDKFDISITMTFDGKKFALVIVCVDCSSSYEIDGKCIKCPRVVSAEAAIEKAGGGE